MTTSLPCAPERHPSNLQFYHRFRCLLKQKIAGLSRKIEGSGKRKLEGFDFHLLKPGEAADVFLKLFSGFFEMLSWSWRTIMKATLWWLLLYSIVWGKSRWFWETAPCFPAIRSPKDGGDLSNHYYVCHMASDLPMWHGQKSQISKAISWLPIRSILPLGLAWFQAWLGSQVVGDGFVSPRIGWDIFVPTQWWTQVPGDKEIPWWIHGTGGAYTVYAYIWWTKNLWFSCRYIYRTSPMDLVRKKLETLLQKTPVGQWQMKVYDGFRQGFWWWLASFVNGRM